MRWGYGVCERTMRSARDGALWRAARSGRRRAGIARRAAALHDVKSDLHGRRGISHDPALRALHHRHAHALHAAAHRRAARRTDGRCAAHRMPQAGARELAGADAHVRAGLVVDARRDARHRPPPRHLPRQPARVLLHAAEHPDLRRPRQPGGAAHARRCCNPKKKLNSAGPRARRWSASRSSTRPS